MKVAEITIEIKTGLPNYSSRTTTVKVVAEEDEAMPIEETIKEVDTSIKRAWSSNGKKPQKVEVKTEPKNEAVEDDIKDILG